jgi:competence protein ComEA
MPTTTPGRKTNPEALTAARARQLAARAPLGIDEDTLPLHPLSTVDIRPPVRRAESASDPTAPGDRAPDPAGSAPAGPGRDWLAGLVPTSLTGARLDPGRRATAALIAVAVAVAGVIAFLTWRSRPVAVTAPPVTSMSAVAAASPAPSSRSSAPAAPIVVAVSGRVRHPGVVRLAAGARVIDAVDAAGGPLPGADLGLLNLARRLTDGELVVVGLPTAPAPAAAMPAGSAQPPGTGVDPGGGVLDLNAATVEQLDGLPGVGPVLAQRIVDYRTAHGRFDSVDRLRDVSGIGDAKFAQLRDKVTV